MGANPEKHCTNAIRGKYSKRFTRHNPDFRPGNEMVMDEFPDIGWGAIYICGVSKKGYPKTNYEHNVHAVVIPKDGMKDRWTFEDWEICVENGYFENIIGEDELDSRYKGLPEEYTTCRMFRWAVSHYRVP